ncbi:hypothetical protein [Nitrosopumilus sp.]|uniref:hypothetical protein n=1 Tax=Nitrosopumilus sp. TaxID=2024843 RepID=UPI00292E0C34|nr:hypothetical protein [Nitrosopumilus sp.]
MTKCKDICARYRASKTQGGPRYANGQKRCQICELFINWEGLWCPCCGYGLIPMPRNKKYKERFRQITSSSSSSGVQNG